MPRTSANETARVLSGTGQIVTYSLFILLVSARWWTIIYTRPMAVKVKRRFINPNVAPADWRPPMKAAAKVDRDRYWLGLNGADLEVLGIPLKLDGYAKRQRS